jgi:hypothetical protein
VQDQRFSSGPAITPPPPRARWPPVTRAHNAHDPAALITCSNGPSTRLRSGGSGTTSFRCCSCCCCCVRVQCCGTAVAGYAGLTQHASNSGGTCRPAEKFPHDNTQPRHHSWWSPDSCSLPNPTTHEHPKTKHQATTQVHMDLHQQGSCMLGACYPGYDSHTS